MSNKSPSYYRRMGRLAFVPGEECRFKNPDAIEGWEQAKAEWQEEVKRDEEQQERDTEYEEVCKLYSAENAADLKDWLEDWVLPMVLEDRGFCRGE